MVPPQCLPGNGPDLITHAKVNILKCAVFQKVATSVTHGTAPAFGDSASLIKDCAFFCQNCLGFELLMSNSGSFAPIQGIFFVFHLPDSGTMALKAITVN